MYEHTNLNLSYAEFYSYLNATRQLEPMRDYVLLSADMTDLPLTTQDVKDHLKLDDANAENDLYYEMLIQSVILSAEFMMRREILTKQFATYTSCFPNVLKLKRAPLISVDSVSYLDSTGVWNNVPTNAYYATQSNGYSSIYPDPYSGWSGDVSARHQSVKVVFTCGMGSPTADSCPQDIKLALLHHIAVLHEQRGDWGGADVAVAKLISNVPSYPRLVYNKYRIVNG